jgi:hypothetical protein
MTFIANDLWKYAIVLSLSSFILLLTACAATRSIDGLSPIDPPLPLRGTAGVMIKEVSTVTPRFEWEVSKEGDNVAYDFAIWKVSVIKKYPNVPDKFHFGEPLYYVENIKQTSHTVTEPLELNTVYMWSVRTRYGAETGGWATYSESFVYSTGVSSGSGERVNWRYPFRTPSSID